MEAVIWVAYSKIEREISSEKYVINFYKLVNVKIQFVEQKFWYFHMKNINFTNNYY